MVVRKYKAELKYSYERFNLKVLNITKRISEIKRYINVITFKMSKPVVLIVLFSKELFISFRILRSNRISKNIIIIGILEIKETILNTMCSVFKKEKNLYKIKTLNRFETITIIQSGSMYFGEINIILPNLFIDEIILYFKRYVKSFITVINKTSTKNTLSGGYT
jgi:hypothetical protein